MPISVSAAEQQPTISVDNPNAITTQLSPDATEYRAQSAAFGVGRLIGADKDQIKNTITNGNEEALRQFSAAKVNELKTQQIRDWTATGSVSDETLKDIAKFQDPKSVFEEHYAKSYMNYLNWPTDPKQRANDNWAYTSQINLPEHWDWVKNAGSQSIARDNYLIAKKQNDDANWTDTLSATVKDVFTAGLYGEVQMRQNTAGTSALEFPGLGHQIQAQSENLNQIADFADWRAEVDRVWELLPKAYRSSWADAMMHQSSADVWQGDMQTALNALPVAKPVTNLGRNLLTAEGRAASFATSGSSRTRLVADTMRMESHFNRIIQAVDDMTTPRPGNVAPEVAGPAMAGDVHESAVNKVAIDGINELKGTNNPLVEFINRLSAMYDTDGTLALSSPANLGREAANRLRDMFDARKKDFIDTVFNNLLQRVDRTPTVELKEQLRKIQLNLAELYRGPDAQVVNVSRGIWLPGFNHRLFNVAVGTVDAGLFGSIEEARAVARRNGWAVKGDYAVSQEERVAIARKENSILGWRKQAELATTPEGKKRALIKAYRLQKELDAIPRHTTGVTIEGQEYWDSSKPFYSSPIGPQRTKERLTDVERKGSTYQGLGDINPGVLAEMRARKTATSNTVRFYHGGDEPTTGGSRWVTPDYDYARNYRGGPNNVHYVDIPKGDPTEIAARMWDDIDERSGTNMVGLYGNTEIPEHWAKQLRPVKEDTGLNNLREQMRQSRAAREAESKPEIVLQRLDKQLGRKATFDEWVAAVKAEESDLPEASGAKSKSEGWRVLKNGKIAPKDMASDETFAEYRARKESQRLYEQGLDEKVKETPSDKPPIADPVIVQQGNGYYILHTVFLPENATFVKDGLLTSDLGKLSVEEFRAKKAAGAVSTGIPNDWANGWVNAITNQIGVSAPSEVLSIAENLNRQIATHGPAVLLGLMKRGLQPISKVFKNPQYANDFNRLIRYTQNAFDPVNKTPGIWFDTVSDVNAWYDRTIRRLPSEDEIQAYFAFKTIMLDDLNFRNLSVMTRKLALGAKQHSVRFQDAYGANVQTPFFEGVRLDTLPEEGRALYVRNDGSKKYGRVRTVIGNVSGLEQDIADGRAQIIHLMDPKTKPLKNIDPRGVDYVISYNTEEKPLGMQHVNRLGGGHQVPKYDFFAKQADVDVSQYTNNKGEIETFRRYNGDKTMLSFMSRAQAEEAIQYLEPVRKLIARWVEANPNRDLRDIERWENEGGAVGPDYLGEAAQLAQRTGIPFGKLMRLWAGPDAPFDVNEPIQVVRKGERIMGIDNSLKARHPGLEDGTVRNESSLLAQSMVEFTQERDNEGLWTMRKTGTESNPYFAYEPAQLVDPITSLENGYKNIIQSMYMYDMKMYSMNHWLEQAKNWLKVKGDPNSVRQNPLKHFFDPEYVDNIDNKIKWQLENNRQTALDFIGLSSTYESAMRRLGQDTFDSLYGAGKITFQKLNDLPSINKWSQWAKNVAFWSTMTSFKSFFTQAASMANIYIIAGPENASKATAAMYNYGLYKRFSGNEAILDAMDKNMARYHDWQPGRFKEAVQMFEGSGLNVVGPEHAFRQGEASLGLQSMDNINAFTLGLKMTQRAGRAMLDIGGAPFDWGAYTTRASGFFTAYLEYLDKAPAGIIDRPLQAAIMGRASLLDSNMSRAHNSWLQNHWMSIPAQFMSYDIRNAQMMWGKALTKEEKGRMLAWSTALYGLKGGGALLFGLPLAQLTYDAAQEAGYVPGDNWLMDVAMSGFPSWYIAMLSGGGDPKKGTWIDFSRWGSRGIDAIDHIFDTDKTIAEQATGVAGSFISNLVHSTWGIRQATADAFKEDGYRLTSDDLLQVAKTIAIVGDVSQAYLAFRTGSLFTKNETNITNINALQTFLKLFTGLTPTSAAEVFMKQKYMESKEKDLRALESHLTAEVTRAYREGSSDPDAYHRHMKNAVAIQLLIPDAKRGEAEKSAFRNIEFSLRERLNEKLYIQLKNDFTTYQKVYQRGF